MMAKALAVNGAKKVYILGRRADALEKAASEHSAVVPLQCDITSKESLQKGKAKRAVYTPCTRNSRYCYGWKWS